MTNQTITTGPSKLDLMLALFDRPHGEARLVTFQTDDGAAHELYIMSVEAEDGSKESWNIKAGRNGFYFAIYYRTDNRKGSFKPFVYK